MAELRVLMVERQPRLGWAFEQALRRRFDVETVEIIQVPTAELALLDAVKQPPDLLIADLDQQGMAGDRFLRRFQRLCPGVPILVILGPEQEDQRETLQELADGLLMKPFTPRQLLQEAARLLIQTGTLHPPREWEPVEEAEEDEAALEGLAEDVPPERETAPLEQEEPDAEALEEQRRQAEKAQAAQRLREILQTLRRGLQAQGVFLVSDDGTLLDYEGSPPGEALWDQVQDALRSLIRGGQRLSRVLQAPYAQNLHVSYGEHQTFLFRAVDDRFWLWLVLPRDLEWVTRLSYLDAAAETLRETLGVLHPTEPLAPPLPETAPLDARKVDEALLEITPPPPEEAERFWEDVLQQAETQGGEDDPEVLSFEEARRLGLLSRDLPGLAPGSTT